MLWARAGADGPAAWLRLPDGIVGLAPPAAPLGPTWVRRAERWPALVEGEQVAVAEDGLRAADGRLIVDRQHALGWLGPLPDPALLSAAPARTMVAEALGSCRPSVLLGAPWWAAVEPALAVIGRSAPLEALRITARALGGLGPGLTPAGDDALSGILFAFRALGGATVEPALVAAARSVGTSDLGAAVLESAARGHHIEPVHDLVMAAAAGDGAAAGRAALALDGYGSSSGGDIAFGLRAAVSRS